ncbi:MAG: hypothetical protein HY897_12180 [Deltaproteobacteria bacterium]|nr:hypothetical protein [Deltaproteobacteria bacterium]
MKNRPKTFVVLVASVAWAYACSGGEGTGTPADVGGGRKVCRGDSECPPGQKCQGGYCAEPSNAQCTSNSDCGGGICGLITNTCTPGSVDAGDASLPADAGTDVEEAPDGGEDAGAGDAGFDSSLNSGPVEDSAYDAGMPEDVGGEIDGSAGFDAGLPGPCTRICDCPQGYYCDMNSLQCAQAATRRFYCCEKYGCPTGHTCEHIAGTLGFCPATNGRCSSTCDCPQGYVCTGGRCSKGAQPVYCCTRLGCPKNAGCEDPYGQQSMCPDQTGWECTNNCDCMQQHVECTPEHKCLANDQATHCCDLPNCTSGSECVKADGLTLDVCGQCGNDCDCPQGYPCMGNECIMAFQSPFYCCEKPDCPAGQDCTDRNDNMGSCPGAPGQCFTDCDCPQGFTCKAGTCDEDITLPAYCCDRPNCPEYDACTDKWGNPGKCPKIEI